VRDRQLELSGSNLPSDTLDCCQPRPSNRGDRSPGTGILAADILPPAPTRPVGL
jgi:hypothetical protein